MCRLLHYFDLFIYFYSCETSLNFLCFGNIALINCHASEAPLDWIKFEFKYQAKGTS